MSVLSIILLAALGITILGSVIGFGTKLILIAVMSLFIDLKAAIFIVAIYSMVCFLIRIAYFRDHLDRGLALKMLGFMIPGIAIGLFLFDTLDTGILKLVFSLFLVGYVVYQVFGLHSRFHLGFLGLGVFVFFFGLLEGAIGAAGPLLACGLLHYGKKKEGFIVFSAFLFIVSSIIRVGGYAYLNVYDLNIVILLVLPLFAVAAAGTWLGRHLLKRMHENKDFSVD